LLASVREDRGAHASARESLRQGLARHPSSDLLWLALARLELANGRHREALSAYASAERLRPQDEALANEYHDALERFGTDEERRAAAVAALVIEAAGRAEAGDHRGAQKTLAEAKERAGKVQRLIQLVDLRSALLLVRRGEHAKALALLEGIIKAGVVDAAIEAEVLIAASEVQLSLSRPKEAIRSAERAIVIEPRNVLAHANLSVAFAAAGEREKAIKALRKACELGLPRRLTYAELMAMPAIRSLESHPEFEALVREAWPRTAGK
jgi:tetratricopeptide (TPR) repeat protein